jgi:hypothetical protein
MGPRDHNKNRKSNLKMKNQTNSTTKAHFVRGAFLLLLLPLLAICMIPFARGQRNISRNATAQFNKHAIAKAPQITNVHGTAPVVSQKSPLVPFVLQGPVGVVCPSTITHSTSQTIIDGNSVACNDGFGTTENHYWRAFDMNTFTGGQEYDVTSVSFGIELAQSGDGTGQPLTVNLYANHNAPFPDGDWQSNLIATSGSINIPDQVGTIFEVPITATVPAGTLELVMEVMTPDGTAVGNLFFIGSNPDPETGPSYLSAVDCGVPDPTPTGDLGFPDMHIVMNVNGSCPSGTPTPSPTPSGTSTPSPTATPSPSPRATPTPRPRPTPFPRPTPPTASPTPTTTPTSTPTPSGTVTPTPSATVTPTVTPTPSPTARPRPAP